MALTKVPSNLDAAVAITQSASDNSTNVATTAYVTTAIANLVDGAPSTLNTLDEIAAALNDDAALNTTLTTSIATKLPLAGGTMTGALTINSGTANTGLSITSTDAASWLTMTDPTASLFFGNTGGEFALWTGGSEAMRVDGSGNVGIGTDSPAGPLHVDGHTGSVATILEGNGNGDTVPLHFRTKANNGNVTNYGIFGNAGSTGTGNTILIGPTNSSGLTVNSSGNVGIGTNNPASPLHVKTTDQSIQIRNTGNANVGLEIYRDSDGAKGASIAWGNGNANLEIKNYRNDGQSTGPYANIDFFTGGTDADSPDFNPTRRMRIQQTGQVGIGVDDPISQLHVNKDTSGHNTDGITLGKVEANGWIDTDEEMGRLSWAASYGSSFTPAIGAYISAKADANWNGNEAPTRLGFFTAPENSLTPVERLRITKDGNVGIGNSSPSPLYWPNGSTGGLFLQAGGLLSAYNAGTNLSQNWYYNAGEKFIGNGGASRYVQSGQEHIWSHSTAVNSSGAGAGLTWSESMRISNTGDVILAANATGAALIKGVSGNQVDRNAGGYPQYTFVGNEGTGMRRPSSNELAFDNSGAESMRLDSSGNVGIGETQPDAILTIGSTGYVQEWKYAKGFKKNDTGVSGANGNYSESTVINVASYRGVCVDYYESGHYFNNGAAYYFRHSKIYVIMEGSTFRVSDVVLQRSMGNRTDAIVSAPSLTTTASGQFTITSTILSGFTHYVSVDAVGGGFVSIGSIG
jgi:hypothetical protein